MSEQNPGDEHRLSEVGGYDFDAEFVRVFGPEDSRYGRVRDWFRSIEPRLEDWKLARSRDGDYSSFLDRYEQVVVIPMLTLAIVVSVLGMYFSAIIDFDLAKRAVLTVWLVCMFVSIPLRYIILFILRHRVYYYTQDRIDDRWILDVHGRVEDARSIDDLPFDE